MDMSDTDLCEETMNSIMKLKYSQKLDYYCKLYDFYNQCMPRIPERFLNEMSNAIEGFSNAYYIAYDDKYKPTLEDLNTLNHLIRILDEIIRKIKHHSMDKFFLRLKV